MAKGFSFIWFLMGLGSQLQLWGVSLSITEVAVLIVTPCILFGELRMMRRDGVMTLFVLSVCVIVGCIISSLVNHSPFQAILRGMATTCILSCSIVVSHWLIRRNPSGFKWFLLGVALSYIVSTFIFKRSVEVATTGESLEEMMSGPLFWISRIKPWLYLPSTGWYLHVPVAWSATVPVAFAIFSMLITASGRSAALGSIGFAVIALIGRNKQKSMQKLSRNFWKLSICAVLLIGVCYFSYKTAASRGWLGESAQRKYEMQTKGGQGGIGRLLLGGRAESFIGLLACRDNPIIGCGPWAIDEDGYAEEFLSRFGTWEDLEALTRINEYRMRAGMNNRLLACHSYITEFWLWYGIAGLVFWLYILFVLMRYLKKDVAHVPQWFGWLACSIPGMLWSIFFSPFADRFGTALFVVACLMVRAVRKGKFVLPADMMLA